jgi:hypothetical protein
MSEHALWHAEALMLREVGDNNVQIARKLGVDPASVSRFLSNENMLHVADDFVEPHQYRKNIPQTVPDIVARFIKAGGGEKARKRMMDELRKAK